MSGPGCVCARVLFYRLLITLEEFYYCVAAADKIVLLWINPILKANVDMIFFSFSLVLSV